MIKLACVMTMCVCIAIKSAEQPDTLISPVKEVEKTPCQQCDELIKKMINILRTEATMDDPINEKRCADAIDALGELRAVEAIPILLQLLDYDCHIRPPSPNPTWYRSVDKHHMPRFGAVEALAKIGYASIPGIANLLCPSEPPQIELSFIRRLLAVELLVAFLGKDQAKLYLKSFAKLSPNVALSKQLDQAYKQIDEESDYEELKSIVQKYNGNRVLFDFIRQHQK